jgi:SOS response regulatory protein OraA/RecX
MGIGGDPEKTKALEVALRMLRVRDRFESEIRARCADEGCSQSEIEAAIDSLRLRKFVDDRRVAKNLAFKLTQTKAWAPARIESELRHRGASEEAIDDALRSLPDESATLARFVRMQRAKGSALARKLCSAGFSEDAVFRYLESAGG